MKNDPCAYLLTVIESLVEDINPEVLDRNNNREDLREAIAGIDSLIDSLNNRVDRQASLISALEASLMRLENQVGRMG